MGNIRQIEQKDCDKNIKVNYRKIYNQFKKKGELQKNKQNKLIKIKKYKITCV